MLDQFYGFLWGLLGGLGKGVGLQAWDSESLSGLAGICLHGSSVPTFCGDRVSVGIGLGIGLNKAKNRKVFFRLRKTP